MKELLTCPNCRNRFSIEPAGSPSLTFRYCPFCSAAIADRKETTFTALTSVETTPLPPGTTVSFLQEHVPEDKEILFAIGPYQILRSIGKGGMGEVFLAYDTSCGRRIALKNIRPDLVEHKQLHNRFLKEAHITSQLTHPAIIPIYAIHSENNLTYYTMPYVEGETLKQLLRTARKQEQQGRKMDHVAESIPALIRIFLSICQAVAYAHSKNVLHRDLKPENIIVGQYGQIVILDWGLAKMLKPNGGSETEEAIEDASEASDPQHHITNIGKVVGTVAYMAPERALGKPANFQTDIYSLGVTLYQLLTLHHPFHRESLKEFRLNMHKEIVHDPAEVAPYRDVPRSLSRVVLKCLAKEPENRYQTVDQLIHDLENYIEGRSEWFQISELDINRKKDWEFQENVFIAEHVALTRGTDASDWVSLMISKDSFQETIKLEASVAIKEKGNGIGFLLSIPEAAERQNINDGYCLWLGTETNRSTKLLRSTVEVLSAPDVFLRHGHTYRVRIEKIENNIHLYLNDALQFSYISHLPLAGTHVGLLLRDANLEVKDFLVFIGSQNVTVNCLAVPDAFLAHKDYTTALTEYRRIGYSFPGRAEGREAMFRAGITLLEQANTSADPAEKQAIFDSAQDEFHKLHNTPGAPLEYLGKALVYQALDDYEEESKCFELAYRRYPRHPLLPVLQEQIVYRMHETSRHNRQATFNFILLTLRYLPEVATQLHTVKLLKTLEKHWEYLFFMENDPSMSATQEQLNCVVAIKLAFWLAKPYVLAEILDELQNREELHPATLANILFCMIELGSWKLAQKKLESVESAFKERGSDAFDFYAKYLQLSLSAHAAPLIKTVVSLLDTKPESESRSVDRTLLHLIEIGIESNNLSQVRRLLTGTADWPLSNEARHRIDCYAIWVSLHDKDFFAAGESLQSYPIELLSQDTSLLHFLYGCWLEHTEGKDIAAIHFSGIFDVPYPRTWNLGSYYLRNKINEVDGWITKSFLWERRQLYRQLALHHYSMGEDAIGKEYSLKAQNEIIDAD